MGREQDKRWAVFRVALGNAQIFGAVLSVCLLAQVGLTWPTWVSFAATTVFLVLSLFLFRDWWWWRRR